MNGGDVLGRPDQQPAGLVEELHAEAPAVDGRSDYVAGSEVEAEEVGIEWGEQRQRQVVVSLAADVAGHARACRIGRIERHERAEATNRDEVVAIDGNGEGEEAVETEAVVVVHRDLERRERRVPHRHERVEIAEGIRRVDVDHEGLTCREPGKPIEVEVGRTVGGGLVTDDTAAAR